MKSTDDLFRLIKSLTKSEKRYFKINVSGKQGGNRKNYLKLFHAIEKQKEYDEKKIISKFAGSTFIKHLPSEKNYLYNLILKSLHLFHTASSKDKNPDELLHCSEILYKKGLYLQSKKMMEKAEELAIKNESFTPFLKSAEIRVKLASKLSPSHEEMEKRFTTAFSSSRSAMEKITNALEYLELKSQLFLRMRNEGEILRNPGQVQELKNIMQHPLLESEVNAQTYEAKSCFYWIKGTYCSLKNDLEEAYLYRKKELELAELSPGKTRDISSYSRKVANMCDRCLRSKKYNEISLYLDKLKKLNEIPGKTILEEAEIFYRYYDNLMALYVQTGEFETGYGCLHTIEKGLEKHKTLIHRSRAIDMHYYIAWTCFGFGDYKKCLKWVNRILDEKTDLRKDFSALTRILNYMTHYELGNTLQLEHVLKSTLYFLHTRGKMYKAEMLVIKYMGKFHKAKTQKERAGLFRELKNLLTPLQNIPLESVIFEYLDILSWLDSKIENRSFSEIVRSKVKAG